MSDHDLLMKIHDRVFECATKKDVETISKNAGLCCVGDHEKRYHPHESKSSRDVKPWWLKLMAPIVASLAAVLATCAFTVRCEGGNQKKTDNNTGHGIKIAQDEHR